MNRTILNKPLLIGSSVAGLFAVIALVWAARPALSTCNAPPEFSQSTASGREWQADWAQLEAIQATLPAAPASSLELPIAGRLRNFPQTYGQRSWGAIHYGQDFLVPVGTPVRAVTSGVLWRVGFQAVGGLELYIVGAGGRRYYYAHLSALEDGVQSGVSVKAGQLLGYSGSTGMAHGVAHLHLGVYTGARQSCSFQSIDPYPLLQAR